MSSTSILPEGTVRRTPPLVPSGTVRFLVKEIVRDRNGEAIVDRRVSVSVKPATTRGMYEAYESPRKGKETAIFLVHYDPRHPQGQLIGCSCQNYGGNRYEWNIIGWRRPIPQGHAIHCVHIRAVEKLRRRKKEKIVKPTPFRKHPVKPA